MATPIIYENTEQFEIGGCNVVRKSGDDKACIIAAGVTLHEALKAHEKLQEKGINVSVIDLYSIKPLDVATIIEVGQKSGNTIVTVEDHYLEGGLGQAVTCALANTGIRVKNLAVTELPRSGKPKELLAWAGIDSASIVKAVGHL